MPSDTSVRVRFTQDRIVFDHNGEIEQQFTAGKTYALNHYSAHRWIIRGVAVPADEPKAAAPAPADGDRKETLADLAEAGVIDLGGRVVKALARAGFSGPQSVIFGADDELLAVWGINEENLPALRADLIKHSNRG